jgi:uncharacterized protein (DUF305 family)
MKTRRGRLILIEVVAVVLIGGVGLGMYLANADRSDSPGVAASPVPPDPIDLPGVPDASAPIIQPGRPGEPARTIAPEAVPTRHIPDYNAADVRFVTMMIPHHEQALELARLAPGRAENPQIIALAERILAAQEPEIGAFKAWLQTRGLGLDAGGGRTHDHTTMSGMQSPEKIRALTAARGAAFDRMFVEMMTDHHQGAIEMANEAMVLGSDLTINEWAESIAVEQAVEINRMKQIIAPSAG